MYIMPKTSGRNAWIISGVSVSNQSENTACHLTVLLLYSSENAKQAGIGLSALPLLMGQAGKGKGRLSSDSDDESDGNDQLLWAVSGVVSAIPFVNWLSWVCAACASPARMSCHSSTGERAEVSVCVPLARDFPANAFTPAYFR